MLLNTGIELVEGYVECVLSQSIISQSTTSNQQYLKLNLKLHCAGLANTGFVF
jgi:hypothetical protein